MSFSARNLSVLAYANGFTSWHYKAKDGLDEVLTPGFFDLSSDMLTPGDYLIVSNQTGGFSGFITFVNNQVVFTKA